MAQRIQTDKKKQPLEHRKFQRRMIFRLWATIGIAILCVVIFFVYLIYDGIPSFEELENPKYFNASIVYSHEGEPYGKYFVENRESIRFEDLNPHLVDALIATEDERYFKHSGVDVKALARVATKTLIMGRSSAGGGSTITQQLAKLLFSRPELSGKSKLGQAYALFKVKLKEWITAAKLERAYTKEEIIAMYLNKQEFIYNAHGIQAAAQTYFGKNQDELTLSESAVLVGMLKNPVRYNPKINPELSKIRRNVVLNQMRKNKLIKREIYDSLNIIPIDNSQFRREQHTDGPAPYARMELTKLVKSILADPVHFKSDGTPYDIYRDGLKIYTTIDLTYQKHAENAMFDHMKSLQQRFFKVWEGRDPWTYRANDYQKGIRQRSLDIRLRESERYQGLWIRYFGDLEEQIDNRIGKMSLNEDVLILIQREENNPGKLDELVKGKRISTADAERYKSLLNSKIWPELKNRFLVFEKAVRKAFNTKVQMPIFDYTEEGFRIVEMTPLDSVRYHRMHLQIGGLAVDPKTGYIKAWVGGVNHRYFMFDHINSRRQVGSTFKPFVYATAIALQGISPCLEFQDIQYTIPAGDPNFGLLEPWSPTNADGKFTGRSYNLFEGLKESKNSISVKLMTLLGNVESVRGLVHNMGIDSSERRYDGDYVIPKVPSICLGAADISVMEMTGAYTAFANNGVYVKPTLITRILDKNGRLIYADRPERNVALNSSYNYVMVEMLKKNVSGIPGRSQIQSSFGGKTGTTNDFTDGWFMGITPTLVIGTWVGGEDPWIRFLDLASGQGSVMARPFCTNFLKSIENDPDCNYDPTVEFLRPAGELEIEIDCDRYRAAQGGFNNYNGKEDELLNQSEIDF